MVHQFDGKLLRYPPLPGMDRTDGVEELFVHLSLQQVTSCSCLESSYHSSVTGVSSQDDDPGSRGTTSPSLISYSLESTRNMPLCWLSLIVCAGSAIWPFMMTPDLFLTMMPNRRFDPLATT